jgi:hypothetical protein
MRGALFCWWGWLGTVDYVPLVPQVAEHHIDDGSAM